MAKAICHKRVKDLLDQSWSYDLAGNMLSNSAVGVYEYPTQGAGAVRPHTPVGVNGEALSYDDNGNLIARGSRSYVYDGENRLTSVSGAVFFAYGPDGERIRKTDGFGSTAYLGNDIEYASGVYTYYIHPDVKLTGGSVSYLHRDHLASVRLETEASPGMPDPTERRCRSRPIWTPATPTRYSPLHQALSADRRPRLIGSRSSIAASARCFTAAAAAAPVLHRR